MVFVKEAELETYLRNLIETKITAQHPYIYALKNKKAVDIVICRDGDRPALFFLEVKLYQQTHSRLPIGTGKGNGYQPEIVTRNPRYLESNLRWVIVDNRQSRPLFLFVPTSTVSKYLAGGGVGEKFNNIQLKIFRDVTSLDEDGLVDALLN